MQQTTYVEHWVSKVLSDDIILYNNFEEYMAGFEHRYTEKELNDMTVAWVNRKKIILDKIELDKQNYKEPVKIIELVTSGKQRFFIIDREPDFKYKKFEIPGEGLFLIAEDGPLVSCYRFETPVGKWKAFGGREFDIPMTDGTVTKANGQWWHDTPKSIYKYYYEEGVRSLKDLTDCFVFCSAMVKKSVVDEFLATNPVAKNYREYESELHKKKSWRMEYDKEFKTEENWEGFYAGKKSAQVRIDELQARSSFLYNKVDAALEHIKENGWHEESEEYIGDEAAAALIKIAKDLQDGVDRAYKPNQEKTNDFRESVLQG